MMVAQTILDDVRAISALFATERRERAPATVTFRSDMETFVLLMFGRLPLSEALAQRRLVAEGEAAQVDACAQWFRGA